LPIIIFMVDLRLSLNTALPCLQYPGWYRQSS
jgi:hypothetical protein